MPGLTLATGIPDLVSGSTFSYVDRADVDVDACDADPETLVVHNAGGVLYRIRLNQRQSTLLKIIVGAPAHRGSSPIDGKSRR